MVADFCRAAARVGYTQYLHLIVTNRLFTDFSCIQIVVFLDFQTDAEATLKLFIPYIHSVVENITSGK